MFVKLGKWKKFEVDSKKGIGFHWEFYTIYILQFFSDLKKYGKLGKSSKKWSIFVSYAVKFEGMVLIFRLKLYFGRYKDVVKIPLKMHKEIFTLYE